MILLTSNDNKMVSMRTHFVLTRAKGGRKLKIFLSYLFLFIWPFENNGVCCHE